jgi:hypothetical protein
MPINKPPMSSLSLRKVIRWRGGMKERKRRKKTMNLVATTCLAARLQRHPSADVAEPNTF